MSSDAIVQIIMENYHKPAVLENESSKQAVKDMFIEVEVGLAHRTDNPLTNFQVNELLIEESFFLRRFASLKQVELVLNLQEEIPSIYNEASLLQHVVYRLYMMALEKIESNGKLIICSEWLNETVYISFKGKNVGNDNIKQTVSPALDAALAKIQAKLVTGNQEGNADILQLAVKSILKN